MIDQYGFKDKNIVLLCDVEGVGSKCQPTYRNILGAIDWLVLNAKSGDSLFFSASCHGSQVPDKNKDEDDGEDETICPKDFAVNGQILDDLLRERLADKIPNGAKLVAVIDACHSKTILDLKYAIRPKIGMNGKVNHDVEIDKKHPDTAGEVICISGCKDEQVRNFTKLTILNCLQTSADAFIDGKASGAMTWALLAALKECNYTNVSCSDLLYKIQSLIRKGGYAQSPQMSFGRAQDIDTLFSFC